MRVVSNSSVVSKPKPPGRTQTTSHGRGQVTTIKPSAHTAPTSLRSRPVPIWFLRLRFWQRRSTIATIMLIGGTLVTYSFTVGLQQQWNQEFSKLSSLQRHERKLTTTKEVLKNQLATQAEQPSTGLLPPNPADAIVLQPSSPTTRDRAANKPEPPPKIEIPSGY